MQSHERGSCWIKERKNTQHIEKQINTILFEYLGCINSAIFLPQENIISYWTTLQCFDSSSFIVLPPFLISLN